METDEELYESWVGGNRPAGGRLVDRYLQGMARFFANKVTGGTDTEDLVGETFELCARSLGKFRGASSFRTYLYGIARNVLRDYLRRVAKRGAEVDLTTTAMRDLGPSPAGLIEERKEQALLLEALRSIPLAYQLVIELSFFEEMTRAEIAEVLELPPGTVATRIRKGKSLLYAKIEALAESRALVESTMHGLSDWARQIQAQLDADSDD